MKKSKTVKMMSKTQTIKIKKLQVLTDDKITARQKHTKIMGIVNTSPDSFSADGILPSSQNALNKAIDYSLQLIAEGADILDIGGESTRPGAKRITLKEEESRVIPLLKALVKQTSIPLSVDTYKPSIAKQALDCGATIINNIKGTRADQSLLKMINNYDASIVLMHSVKTPSTMQKNIFYRDVIIDVMDALSRSIKDCLDIGIDRTKIIIDPGIGFGKTTQHNLQILDRLKEFKQLKCDLLVGVSRKSFIGAITNKPINERLFGTTAAVCASILNGADIVRVHDVHQIKDAALLTDAIVNSKHSLN